MTEAAADLNRALDSGFRFARLAGLSQHHGLHAGSHSAFILRILLQVIVEQLRGLFGAAQPEQSGRGLKSPQRGISFQRRALENGMSIFIFTSIHVDNAQTEARYGVAGVDIHCLFDFVPTFI